MAAYLGQGTSFPGSPVAGDTFFRTDLNQLYVYEHSAWGKFAGGAPTANPVSPTIATGATLPANPVEGTLFFRTDTKVLCVYSGTGWVSARDGSTVT